MATAVTGFVIEAIGKMVSFRMGAFASMSMRPCASKWAMRPRRATTVTAPEICFVSMARWIIPPIRSRRFPDNPTSSGAPAGTCAPAGTTASSETRTTADDNRGTRRAPSRNFLASTGNSFA